MKVQEQRADYFVIPKTDSAVFKGARLGDVTDSMKNGLYKPASEYGDDGVPCLRMYNIDAGQIVWRDIKRMRVSGSELEDYGLVEGDLLVNRVNSRELVGKTALIPPGMGPSVFESKNIRLRLKTDQALPKFINYQLLAFGRQHFSNNAQQVVGMASVSQKQLADFPIVLTSLAQQKRIVAEIEKQFSRLDEAVANLKRVKANLKRYKAAVLKAAVEGRLVETEAESTAFGRQNWKPIGLAIGTLDQGWSPQCESEPAETDETWAVMKTTAVQPLRFSDEENKRLPPTLTPRANLELAAGDLLITRAGPRSRVGVTCLVKTTRPHLMLCDKAYRLRVKPDVALPGFLEIVLNSPDVLYVLDELKTGISDSGLNLTQKRFKELLVPLPPLVEQQRVIAEVERNLSLADEAEAQVNANLQRANRLRQSILSRAFIGVSASSTIAHTTL